MGTKKKFMYRVSMASMSIAIVGAWAAVRIVTAQVQPDVEQHGTLQQVGDFDHDRDVDLRDQFDPNDRPELALYHYRAPAYDPFHGRFLQQDPMLYKDSYNLYLFALSNPLLFTDSSGQSIWDDIDDVTLDLTAHKLVALNYIQQGSGLVVRGINIAIVMHQIAFPGVWVAYDAWRFINSPSLEAGTSIAMSLGGPADAARLAGALGRYVWKWHSRASKLANAGGKALEKAFDLQSHHIIPKFLGGSKNSLTARLTRTEHSFFHAALRDELIARGFPRSLMGGPTGSRAAWKKYLKDHGGMTDEAFDALQAASRKTDELFGLNLEGLFLDEFVQQTHLHVTP